MTRVKRKFLGFYVLLLLLMMVAPMVLADDGCANKKIAIMGASNTVEKGSSYTTYIKNSCAGATVNVYAEEGYSIQEQKDKLLDNALKGSPNILVVSPSGNTCSKNRNVDENIEAVKSVIQKAVEVPVEKIIVLTISPRGNVNYKECILKFNKELVKMSTDATIISSLFPLGTSFFLKVVDIYPTLNDPKRDGFCKTEFCSKDGLHWTAKGDEAVAAQILTEVFNQPLETKPTEKSSSSPPPSGPVSSSGTGGDASLTAPDKGPIYQNCLFGQRCQEIDEVWQRIAPALDHSSDLVWEPRRKDWLPFDKVYPKPMHGVSPTTTTAAAAAGAPQYLPVKSGAGIVECATEDTSMTNEQKAILDTIAVMEATTSFGIRNSVSSYNIMVGGVQFKDMSKHPRLTGEMTDAHVNKHDSTAAGRYQFLSCSGEKCNNFFPDGFDKVEQDKEAWRRIVEKRKVSEDLLKTASGGDKNAWTEIGNKFALEWASVQYTLPISSDSKWHVDHKESLRKRGITLEQVPEKCGNGRSFYCQGAGYSHERLARIFDLCYKHYKEGGQKGARFYISNGKEVEKIPSPSAPPGSAPAGAPAAAISGVVRFAAIGDYGSGSDNARKVSELVKSWFPQFIITLGDNDYGKSGNTMNENIGKFYFEYIKKPEGYIGEHSGKSPVNRFFPSLGNHDVERADKTQFYLNYFELPSSSSGNEQYYVVDKSPLVRLFALDSERSDINKQKNWLQEELKKSTSCYNLVYFHQPPYALKGIHGSAPKWRWIFDVEGVDAVLTGHEHNYQRYDIKGIPFIINGVGGGGIYEFKDEDNTVDGTEISPVVKFAKDAGYGASFITVRNGEIKFEFKNVNNEIKDTYTYSKPCRISPETIGLTQFGSMLVLGSHEFVIRTNRVNGAFNLFSRGYSFGSVIFSGGKTNGFLEDPATKKQTEAEDMAAKFAKIKPSVNTFTETESTNTIKNYELTSKLIKSQKILSEGDSLLIVSDSNHAEAVAYCFKLIDEINAFYYQIGKSSGPTAPRADVENIPRFKNDIGEHCKKLKDKS